jgi:putative transcriptional regulator
VRFWSGLMNSLKGHFLVAGPSLEDPNFAKAVVLMVQHDSDGAMGLVINRPTELSLPELWLQVKQESCGLSGVVYRGGPCEGPLMALHGSEQAAQLQALPGVFFCADADQLQWLVDSGAKRARFFVGYSGWGAGQLERELSEDAWFVVPASAEQVFEDDASLWGRLVRLSSLSRDVPSLRPGIIPDDPSLN